MGRVVRTAQGIFLSGRFIRFVALSARGSSRFISSSGHRGSSLFGSRSRLYHYVALPPFL